MSGLYAFWHATEIRFTSCFSICDRQTNIHTLTHTHIPQIATIFFPISKMVMSKNTMFIIIMKKTKCNKWKPFAFHVKCRPTVKPFHYMIKIQLEALIDKDDDSNANLHPCNSMTFLKNIICTRIIFSTRTSF